jgi:predicted ester cyclase
MDRWPTADLEANKYLAHRVSREIWSRGDVALVDHIIAPDYVRHASDGELTGREALRQAAVDLLAAIPDWTETLQVVLVEEDLVAYRWIAHGTYRGQLPGLPPTGQPVGLEGQAMHRVVDRLVAEAWSVFGLASMLVQVGAMPAPAAPTA